MLPFPPSLPVVRDADAFLLLLLEEEDDLDAVLRAGVFDLVVLAIILFFLVVSYLRKGLKKYATPHYNAVRCEVDTMAQ